MAIRGVGDGYAFQRLLWLLIGTVIVPTVLLSLFGVAAIRNQGAAVLRELERNRAERLEVGARTLVAAVARVEGALLDRAVRCVDPGCPLALDGTTAGWAWRAGEGVPVELQPLGISSELARDGATVWVSPPDGSPPVAVLASGALRLAWRLDPHGLQGALDRMTADRFPTDVALRLVPPEADGASLASMIGQRDGELVLQRPLTGWRLRLDDAADPTRAALDRAAWLYPASLVLLVGIVVVGTVVTLGSASREIRLSRLQTDFVSSVSHELRTPLTAIKLFVDTLQSGRLQDPSRVQECLDLLSLETDRLSRMIERVLDWARMEAGRRVYDFEAVPPADLAAEALTALRSQRLLTDEPDPIAVDVPRDLPELHVDRDAIVEALLNLLQNAVKFTPSPRRIALRGERRGGWVGLVVEDNGPGIPKRHRRRVFEKFYQVDSTLSAPVQDRGSGLGLSIARAVARAHGGRVELESEVGVGSRFTLLLPVPDGVR